MEERDRKMERGRKLEKQTSAENDGWSVQRIVNRFMLRDLFRATHAKIRLSPSLCNAFVIGMDRLFRLSIN